MDPIWMRSELIRLHRVEDMIPKTVLVGMIDDIREGASNYDTLHEYAMIQATDDVVDCFVEWLGLEDDIAKPEEGDVVCFLSELGRWREIEVDWSEAPTTPVETEESE